MAGTIGYMAPEQIQAHPRPASDQYALGITVYEWLTGDRPFHGSFTEIAVKHSVAPPPPLSEKLPGISPDVEHVVMTAIAKDPQQRFGTVLAFAKALEQASQEHMPTVISERLNPHLVQSVPPSVVAQEARSKDATSSVHAGLKDEDNAPSGGDKSTGDKKTTPTDVRQDQGVLTIRIHRPRLSTIVAALIGIILYSLITARLYPTAFDPFIFYSNASLNVNFSAYDLNILGSLIFFGFAEVVPLFFGSVFSPLVGLLTGGLGFFIGTFYSSSFRNDFGRSNLGDYFAYYNQNPLWGIVIYMALIGFAAGFAAPLLRRRFPTLRNPSLINTLNFVSVLIGAFLLIGIFDSLVLQQGLVWQQLLLLVCFLPGLVVLPYLIMIYEVIAQRVKQRRSQSAVA